ncbi:hypothetical protein MKX03_013546 [Papaver bracteatum]|nr:hypothetical protein MKX03_013546 [Papaver bracteatum]
MKFCREWKQSTLTKSAAFASFITTPLLKAEGRFTRPSLLFVVVACLLEDEVGRGNVQASEDKEQI